MLKRRALASAIVAAITAMFGAVCLVAVGNLPGDGALLGGPALPLPVRMSRQPIGAGQPCLVAVGAGLPVRPERLRPLPEAAILTDETLKLARPKPVGRTGRPYWGWRRFREQWRPGVQVRWPRLLTAV